MKNKVISLLTSCGYEVNNAGTIFKKSGKTNRKEKKGILNDFSVYFYAQNVAPFKHGTNTFKEILGSEYTAPKYIPVAKTKEVEHKFSFSDYISTTKQRNHFTTYLKKQAPNLSNVYDIRGVKTGYLKDATLYPYINYNNEFVTAKIVQYNSLTGKRIKSLYANNFHSYKPIKKELGITKEIHKKYSCFFGEHLLSGNNKPVVIVEAEKTAVILSMLFENIVFLGTGGANFLKGKDYSILSNRDVFLYPDAGVSEWFEIGKKRNWFVSEILENKGTAGSDAADYLEDTLWGEIESELNSISNRELNHKTTGLNFSYKNKTTKRYCSTIVKEIGLNYYTDSATGESFKGEHFRIYENNFEVLTAGVDVNKWQRKKGKLIKPDATIFIKRVEQCFRVLKALNSDADIKTVFNKVLNHLLEYSNYLFNRDYILDVLLPEWDNDFNDVSEYIKTRNYRVRKGNIEETDFLKFLNNDLKAYETNKLLLQIQPLIKENKYIKHNKIGVFKISRGERKLIRLTKQSNEFIYNLIEDYNTKVLGCNTINNYRCKIQLSEYLNHVENITKHLKNEKLLQNFCTLYKGTYIHCKKNVTDSLPSIQTIHDNTLIAKRVIREYLSFKPTRNALNNINTVIEYYISNPNKLQFERIPTGNTVRIQPVSNISIKQMKLELTETNKELRIPTDVAFNYNLNLEDSILNIEQAAAIQKGDAFLYSWILFHNNELTDFEKYEIRINPLQYLLNTDVKISA